MGYGIYGFGLRNGGDFVWQYNTLAKLTADDNGLTITRPIQKYITSSFLHRWGWSIGSDGDGFAHVFAAGGMNANGTTNMYAAKVPFDDIEDTSKVSTLLSNQSSHFAFENPHRLLPSPFCPPSCVTSANIWTPICPSSSSISTANTILSTPKPRPYP